MQTIKQILSSLPAGERIPEKHLYEVLWRRGDLEFLLWPQQDPIWDMMNSIPPHVVEFVILCARQFGKSTLGVLRALSRAIKKRDRCILIMGPDTQQTKDIVRPKMRFLTRTAPPGLIVPMKAENRFHVYHDLDPRASDYSEIIIGGMNENSTSQRGKTVEEILIEEIADLKEDDFKESMEQDLGPALTHSDGGKIIYLTTLPPYPDHPFITETIPKAKLQDAIAIYTIDDNVALSPEQYQACVDRCGGKDTVAFRREYLCEVVRDRNRVCLPDFNAASDVKAFLLPAHFKMHTTIDWGGVRDKTVAIMHTYDYLNDMDLFWDERVFEPNTPTHAIVKSVRAMEKAWKYEIYQRWIDAPMQLVSVDLVSAHDFIGAIPRKSDWQACVNTLNVRFSQRKALIHPRCKFLVQSANSAIFNKNKTDFERSEALGHMDGIAAMMYAVRMVAKDNPYPVVHRPEDHPFLQNASPASILALNPFSQGITTKGFGRYKR